MLDLVDLVDLRGLVFSVLCIFVLFCFSKNQGKPTFIQKGEFY